MHKSLLLLFLLCPFASDLVHAQANAITIVCDACRDPHQYPDDFINFGFNQVYGPDGWLTPAQADDFFVTNLDGQTVYIDMDFLFIGIGLLLFLWPQGVYELATSILAASGGGHGN